MRVSDMETENEECTFTDPENLVELFTEPLAAPRTCEYRGVRFELFLIGDSKFGALGQLVETIIRRTLDRTTAPSKGIYIRVHLPVPFNWNLFLQSRAHPEIDDSRHRLDRFFQFVADDRNYVRQLLEGPLLDALMEMNSRHHVEMSDTQIVYGPIDAGNPVLSAEDLVMLFATIYQNRSEN